MRDQFSREITYLRISITDKCNLRCTYCMGEPAACRKELSAGEPAACRKELSAGKIVEITESAVALGIHKIRITGGEPLVRPDVIEICRRIHAIPGVEELALTTNGVLLERYAHKLKEAGVARLNISLDTLDEKKYECITGGGRLSVVLGGIEAARAAGLLPLKINVVLLKDFNEDEIAAFVEWTRREPVEVRFIELMPIGAGIGRKEQFLSGEAVLRAVPELVPQGDSGVAHLYRLPGGAGQVGLIRPVSCHFCSTCNRIRLTCDGHLKPCLHFSEEIALGHLKGAELREAVARAISQKPMEHEDFRKGKISGAGRSMREIGG